MPLKEKKGKPQDRLIAAACKVFAEKGFRDARVADICRRAGVNGAAVNYYFGGKAALYVEAWQHAFEREIIPDPPESPESSAEDRLCTRIQALVRKFCDQTGGQFTRMYLMELANPTGLIDERWQKLIEPRRQHLLGIIRELMGPDVPDEVVWFCELSVINQCRGFLILARGDLEYLMEQPVTQEVISKLADHITRFSLAGIRSMTIPCKAD